jgi:hypothetical protein
LPRSLMHSKGNDDLPRRLPKLFNASDPALNCQCHDILTSDFYLFIMTRPNT